MSTSHARIALYGSGPALNAAEEVLRMAGRNPMFVANSEELSTADVVLYEGEAPSSLLPEIPVFQVGEGIDLEYGLDPIVMDPIVTWIFLLDMDWIPLLVGFSFGIWLGSHYYLDFPLGYGFDPIIT